MNRHAGYVPSGRTVTMAAAAAQSDPSVPHAPSRSLRALALACVVATALACAGCGPSASRSYKGTFKFFALPSPMEVASDITTGPDGDLWVVGGTDILHSNEKPVQVVARVNTFGKVENTFPAQHGMGNLVRGPDGNVWGSEFDISNSTITIDRISPKGDIARFNVPEKQFIHMTVGPDHNLWISEEGIGAILRMGTDGKVLNTFPTPRTLPPEEITAGPDGNLWIVQGDSLALWRLTPDGKFTDVAVPPVNVTEPFLRSITTGPDGNLWFTQQGHSDSGSGSYVESMTPAGKVTGSFHLPLGGFGVAGLAAPDDLMAAPDGNLWFHSAGTIGRITPDGKVTEFDPPHGAGAGLSVGPDNNIWFADDLGSNIGQLS